LNLQFVTDFLGCVDCDTVKMDLTASNYPVLFSANDGYQRCVIMPMSA
jgi:DNA polymerase III sliding clamp (beta) subunit (PCNA family)